MATDQHRYPSLSRQSSQSYLEPHSTPAQPSVPHHLALPYLHPHRNSSSSSFLDAVIGSGGVGGGSYAAHAPSHASPGVYTPQFGRGSTASTAASSVSHGDSSSLVKISERGESDWDVLSDASGRVNEGVRPAEGGEEGERKEGEGEEKEEEGVKELQKKVAKRRSQLPRLESQLADLEAQIKAAEERLARVQGGGAGGGTGQ